MSNSTEKDLETCEHGVIRISCTQCKEIGFIETDCAFEHEGQKYESGGAFIAKNVKTGRLGGILYESEKTGEVVDWHGKIRIPATYGPVRKINRSDCQGFPQENQSVSFEYQGKRFKGVWYNRQWSQIIRVKESA